MPELPWMPENVLNRVADVIASPNGARHWGCLPERLAKQKRLPPRLPDLQSLKRGAAAKLGEEDLLKLEFATLSLNRGGQVDGEPSEMVISMRPGKVSREGISAIVGLMNKALDLPDVYGWFAVLFDYRSMPSASSRLETALHIMRWDCVPGWQARCMCQCAHCLILVEACVLEEAKQQMATFYNFRPPPYCTFLATEPASDCGSDEESAIRFSPPLSWPAPACAPKPAAALVPPSPGSSAPSTPLPASGGGCAAHGVAQKLAGLARLNARPASCRGPAEKPHQATAASPRAPLQVPAPAPGAQAAARGDRVAAAEPGDEELPPFVESGFLQIKHFLRKDGLEEVVITALDVEQSMEDLEKVINYFERLCFSSVADKGVSTTYDLRGVRMPSISAVMYLASWAAHPDRVERMQKIQRACKVVLSPGLAYTIGKGLLTVFYSTCAPVVRTYVVSDPDEPEETALHFDPSPVCEALSARAEAASEEAAARWAREARLPRHVQEPFLASVASSSETKVPLLNVGFASLELTIASPRAPLEFCFTAGSGAVAREGVSALLELVCRTLSSLQASGDFAMCFDLRGAKSPSEALDLVFRSRRWRGAPEWASVSVRRCMGWRIIVQAGAPFKEVRSALDCFFYLHPPVCPTRLVTSPGDNGGNGSGVSAEWPRENGLGGGVDSWCSLLADGEDGLHLDGPAEAVALPLWHGAGLPCSFDAGFLHLLHSPGQLIVRAEKGRPQTQERLGMVLAFLDDFLQCLQAQGGFTAHFDLRALPLPSLATVCHLAIWGADAARRERWQRLCVSCVVVVGPGLAFLLAKGLLSKFFSLCPPVCRTLLLREPDEPPSSAFFFDPGPVGPEAMPRAANGHGPGVANGGAGAVTDPSFAFGSGGERLHPDDDPWVF